MVDINTGGWGGKTRPINNAEMLAASIREYQKKNPESKPRLEPVDWQEAGLWLEQMWFLSPALPALERVLWAGHKKLPIKGVSLAAICYANDAQWDDCKGWILGYETKPVEVINYQTGQTESQDEHYWLMAEANKWQAVLDDKKQELARICISWNQCESVYQLLTSTREMMRDKESRKSIDSWRAKHRWQGHGMVFMLASLKAAYPGLDVECLPYNQALVLSWYSEEVK